MEGFWGRHNDSKAPKAKATKVKPQRGKIPVDNPLSWGKARAVKKGGAAPQRKNPGVKTNKANQILCLKKLANPELSSFSKGKAGNKQGAKRKKIAPPIKVKARRGAVAALSPLTASPHHNPPIPIAKRARSKKIIGPIDPGGQREARRE
jgi:hypothetical protein